MKKILTVLGARPQFIKASVVSHAIAGLRCLQL
jgi:UDP-N-acetylglucosamine 2-epimerase